MVQLHQLLQFQQRKLAEKRRSILLPKQLSFQDSKLSFRNTSFPSSELSKFRSPLDVFLDEKKIAVEAQKQQVSNARASFSECELMCSAATDARNTRKPVCGKCHLEGHNKLNYEFGECLSVRYCYSSHLLHKHPDEKRQLKNMKKELKTEEDKLARLKEEMEAKAATAG